MDYTPGDLSRFLNPDAPVEVIDPTAYLVKGEELGLSEPKKKKKSKKGLEEPEPEIEKRSQTLNLKHETLMGGASKSKKTKSKKIKNSGVIDEENEQSEEEKSEEKKVEGDAETTNTLTSKPKKTFYPKDKDPRLPRTLFVGNIPVTMKRKAVEQLFKKFGGIESVRCRSVSFANPKVPRKAAFGQKQFREERDSMNAYVVFKSEEAVTKALGMNGTLIEGKAIRVDVAEKPSNDTRCSIFIGNLPFDALEDELREFFKSCGVITNIRLVRDQKLNVGKGFGFVTFREASGVQEALKLNDTEFKERKLRISKALKEERITAIQKRKAAQRRILDKKPPKEKHAERKRQAALLEKSTGEGKKRKKNRT